MLGRCGLRSSMLAALLLWALVSFHTMWSHTTAGDFTLSQQGLRHDGILVPEVQQDVEMLAPPGTLSAQFSEGDSRLSSGGAEAAQQSGGQLTSAVPRRFRINVFTWARAKSLKRLLVSLQTADYVGRAVDLAFFVDYGWNPAVEEVIDSVVWPHGDTTSTYRSEHFGLQRNVMESWSPEAGDDTMCFFFEDDVEVSPLYFRWALSAIEAIGSPVDDPSVLGIALNTPRVNQYTRRAFHKSLRSAASVWISSISKPPLDAGIHVYGAHHGWTSWGELIPHSSIGAREFLLQQPTSWGALYFPGHWRAFVAYWRQRKDVRGVEELLFAVPNSMSNDWDKSWKRFHAEYMHFNGLLMMYPNHPGQRALATTHRETGVHTTDGATISGDLRSKKHWLFTTPLFGRDEELGSVGESTLPVFDLHFVRSSKVEIRARSRSSHSAMNAALEQMAAVATKATPGGDWLLARSATQSLQSGILSAADDDELPRSSRHVHSIPELTMFLPISRLNSVARTALGSLEALWPKASVLVVAPKETCVEVRREHQIAACLDEVSCLGGGVVGRPTMDCMFRLASFYPYAGPVMAFSNGDIIHSPALLGVLAAAKSRVPTPDFVLMGRRIDIFADAFAESSALGLSSDEILERSAGALHGVWGLDYFVFTKSLRPWDDLPPFVIGAARWDNWLLSHFSRRPDVTTVDLSNAYLAVHLAEQKVGVSGGNLFTKGALAAGEHNKKLAEYYWRIGSLKYTNQYLDAEMELHERMSVSRLEQELAASSVVWELSWLAEDALKYTRYALDEINVLFSYLSVVATVEANLESASDRFNPRAFERFVRIITADKTLCRKARMRQHQALMVLTHESVFGSKSVDEIKKSLALKAVYVESFVQLSNMSGIDSGSVLFLKLNERDPIFTLIEKRGIRRFRTLIAGRLSLVCVATVSLAEMAEWPDVRSDSYALQHKEFHMIQHGIIETDRVSYSSQRGFVWLKNRQLICFKVTFPCK